MAKPGKTLDRLPLVDKETGDFTVVLETPKASRNKYRYDARCQAIRLSATLGEGLAFPYDFGFFPSTWARTVIRSTCCCSLTMPCRRVASLPRA
jgi:inorganic pyrophosphatase